MQTQRAVQCLHDVLAMMAALPPAVSCPSRASLTLCVSGQANPECGRVSPMQIDSWAVGQLDRWAVGQMGRWTHTHIHTYTHTHMHTCTHAQLHTVVFLTMPPQIDKNRSHAPHIHRLQQSCSPSLPELTLQEHQAIQHAGHSCSLLCPWLLLTKLAHFIHPSCLMSADELRVYAGKVTLHTGVCMQMLVPHNLKPLPQLSIYLILTQQPLPRHLPAWAWQQDHPVSWAALLSGSRRRPR
jgi:hypothetical protein